MVGSLVVPVEMMSEQAATPKATRDVVNNAVEHFGEDLKRSVNLQKRKTEMYGTLIVDTMENATSSPPPTSPQEGKTSKWHEPMDEVRFKSCCDKNSLGHELHLILRLWAITANGGRYAGLPLWLVVPRNAAFTSWSLSILMQKKKKRILPSLPWLHPRFLAPTETWIFEQHWSKYKKSFY